MRARARLGLGSLLLLAACAAASREIDDAAMAPPADANEPADAAPPDADVQPLPADAAPDATLPPDASVAVCGNGVREGSEECDDGNHVQTDGCPDSCRWARCGDGIVRTGVEECDDSNSADGDACSSICLACAGGDGRFTWSVNHHCYTRFAAAVTWAAARDACAAARAHLVTLDSDAENGALISSLLTGTVNHWLGLSDQTVEGTYAWVTDDPSTYNHYTAGEPNNDGNEDCIETSNVGLWNDNKCSATLPSVCEDEGWFVRAADNHAYRVVYRPVTWSAAVGDCASLGAHLVTLGSAEENDFVLAHGFGNLWGGATDAAVEGTFTWVTGEPYGFTAYQVNEPNNAGAGEDCLELSVGRGWNDLGCAELRGYVCEAD